MMKPPRRTGTVPTLRAEDLNLPDHIACPFCTGLDTELHSAFGSARSVVTYWCHPCRTAFEWFKWGEP